eukprot:3823401-Amphidinium_carterae.1
MTSGYQYQPIMSRIMCANIFDREAEPAAGGTASVLTHGGFLKLLGGLFNPAMQVEDVMAVLKRCNVVI